MINNVLVYIKTTGYYDIIKKIISAKILTILLSEIEILVCSAEI